MKNLTCRRRRVRLLTLICFFHFAGLNNGVTYFVVTAEKIEQFNFSFVVAQRVAELLHPLYWRRVIAEQGWFGLFLKPGKIIHSSSQRAVQTMWEEVLLFQIVLQESYKKALSKTSVIASGRAPISKAESSFSATSPPNSSFLFTNHPYQSIADWFLREQQVALQNPVEYLKNSQEHSWLKLDRSHLWEQGKDRMNLNYQFLLRQKWKWKDKVEATVYLKRWIQKFIDFLQERFGPRLFYLSVKEKDEPASFEYLAPTRFGEPLFQKGNLGSRTIVKITLSFMGDFLFCIGMK